MRLPWFARRAEQAGFPGHGPGDDAGDSVPAQPDLELALGNAPDEGGQEPRPEGEATHTVASVSRNALFTGASMALTVGIGFAISLVTARALGPQGQGLLAALRTNSTMVAAVLGLGTPGAAMYFASRTPKDRPALLGLALLQACLLGAVALGLVAVLGGQLAQNQGAAGQEGLYLLAAVLVPILYLEYVTVNMLRSQQQFQRANLVVITGRVVGLAMTLWLVVALDLGVAGALLAILAIPFSQVAGSLPALLGRGVRLSRQVAKKSVSYGLRAQVGLLFRVAALRFDVLLLSFFVPLKVVGYYTVALVVAETALMVPQAFGSILAPIVAGGGDRQALGRRIVRLSGTTSLLYAGALLAGGPILISLAYGEAYRPAIGLFLVLLPGTWLFASGDLVSWVLGARGQPGMASWLAAYQGAATLVLDLILIPVFGAIGAAAASSVAYGTYGLISLVVLARQDGVPTRTLLLVTPRELRGYLAAARRRLSARRTR